MASDAPDFFAGLEAKGEAAIRRRLTNGEFGHVGSQLRSSVELWLRWKESSRKHEEAMSVAREANSLAQKMLIQQPKMPCAWRDMSAPPQ